MTSTNDIRSVFYSSAHAFAAPEDLVREIAFLVDERYLLLKHFLIATKEEYMKRIETISRAGDYDADGGGIAHIALKQLAADFLRREHGKEVRFEAPFCGYYPDVLSTDATIVAECGQTNNPDKMLAYFREGNISACIQVPYPDIDDTHILGHVFTAGSALKDFLDAVIDDRNSKLKGLIARRGLSLES